MILKMMRGLQFPQPQKSGPCCHLSEIRNRVLIMRLRELTSPYGPNTFIVMVLGAKTYISVIGPFGQELGLHCRWSSY